MASGSQLRSFGQFLYTQNPFYLISCFLILYGLQMATLSGGDLLSRSVFFSLSIVGYMLLMAVTCIGVVRIGKIWEDGRSIFLVVIISQVALSASLDELCISDWDTAVGLMIAGAGLTLAVSELVLRCCRVRLPAWYRVSLYALLAVFFAVPALLGHAVGDRNITLSNWGAPLFSCLIGLALMLLAPAVRRGRDYVQNNGTPWTWPLYPLSAFVILIVLAAIRTHAIWMSFGFIGSPVRFEAFLLLPIALAVMVLFVESDAHKPSPKRAFCAMGLAPLLLLCSMSRDGLTFLPIQADLQTYFGSTRTIVLVSMVAFYLYTWIRGLTGASFAVTATLLGLCGFSELPTVAESAGFQHWMYGLCACLFSLVTCFRNPRLDYGWLTWAVVTAVTMLMAGDAYDHLMLASVLAATLMMAACLAIGAMFQTELASFLRHIAALILTVAAAGLLAIHFSRSSQNETMILLAALGVLSVTYMQIVKRTGWIFVAAIQAGCFVAAIGWSGYWSESASNANWPIHSGLLCFVIGVTITSVKTGAHRRIWRRIPSEAPWQRYQSGF
ncbi:MAG: hypothetical protein AB8B91_11280 [Rubripirellula sp.]